MCSTVGVGHLSLISWNAGIAMADCRIDAWLWAVRVVKTRSAATALCRTGQVRVNGERAKAALHIKLGDEVRFHTPAGGRVVVIAAIEKGLSATV
jgi:ribosome-associated heat shock protein Hsp15